MVVHLRLHSSTQGMIRNTFPEPFQFPGGEWHLRNLPEIKDEWGEVTYIADVRGADVNDLVKAALWADVADSGHGFILMLPYLPAARSDRGKPTGAWVYASLVDSFSSHTIALDPHSPVITQFISGLVVADHTLLVREAFDMSWMPDVDALIAPDEGAKERTHQLAKAMGGIDVYQATKHRDFDTGKLSGFEVEKLPAGGHYLVADDICDGGGTFMGLADATGLDRDHLSLWVTHGVFSGNAGALRDHYRHIVTTDSHPGSNRVDVATMIIPSFLTMFTAANL